MDATAKFLVNHSEHSPRVDLTLPIARTPRPLSSYNTIVIVAKSLASSARDWTAARSLALPGSQHVTPLSTRDTPLNT
eukprot:132557-Rhodomonas_salina.1